jgi:hypothetical protein
MRLTQLNHVSTPAIALEEEMCDTLEDASPEEQEVHIAVRGQIARILEKMERTNNTKEKAELALIVVRLWNLVYPTAGYADNY